jgi:dTMP kinase
MAKGRFGRFVTFEGGEGAGKTTQTNRLALLIRDRRAEQVLVTREPGGSIIGNAIRTLLVSKAAAGHDMDLHLDIGALLQERVELGGLTEEGMKSIQALLLGPGNIHSATTEALLHFAARSEHWECALKPMLKKYPWVICDRFADSTMAYQGYAGGAYTDSKGYHETPPVGRERIEALVQFTIPGVRPDLTFIMDLDPEVGLKRAAARKSDSSSYETRRLGYHRRVREGFLDIARREPDRCVVIDAARDEDDVTAEIWRGVEAFLAREPATT